MSELNSRNQIYRLVLTGGPCGGKTTAQARLSSFFENLGWRVYRVPETATVLLGGGVKFAGLSEQQVFSFQENLVQTMLKIEQTFFDLAMAHMTQNKQSVLIICDRGVMDATAYMLPGQWKQMKEKNNWNDVDFRGNRYDQVIHMVSAAKGAEVFYQTDIYARHEDLQQAIKLDELTAHSWVGHPYYDLIDNSTEFQAKVNRVIAAVCHRLSIEVGDGLQVDSKKRKFLIASLPGESLFPDLQDFIVMHDYLVTPNSEMQARIRRRGQNVEYNSETQVWNLDTGNWTYTHTIRRPAINKSSPEVKMQIHNVEYKLLIAQRDTSHCTINKIRRCFLWKNQYYQMDIYQEPCKKICKDLIMLETYTTMKGNTLVLPDFLNIVEEVTDDPKYSMFNLSKIMKHSESGDAQ